MYLFIVAALVAVLFYTTRSCKFWVYLHCMTYFVIWGWSHWLKGITALWFHNLTNQPNFYRWTTRWRWNMQHTEGWQMNPVKIYLFSRWETRTSSRISKVPSSYSDSFSKHTVQIYIFPSKDKIVMDIISVLLLYLEKQNCSTSHHQQEYFSIPISTQMHHSFFFFLS